VKNRLLSFALFLAAVAHAQAREKLALPRRRKAVDDSEPWRSGDLRERKMDEK